MTEAPQRRSLFPRAVSTTPPDPEAIAAVARSNGFPEVATPPAAEPTPAPAAQVRPEPGQDGARRRRQPTGRDHQFNTRLRLDTRDLIYSEANGRNIPVAQVIEEAMAALLAQRQHS